MTIGRILNLDNAMKLILTLFLLSVSIASFGQDYPESFNQEQQSYKEGKPCKNSKCDNEDLPIDKNVLWAVAGAIVLGFIYINRKIK